MMITSASSFTAFLALLWLPMLSHAQSHSNGIDTNVTLRLFPGGSEESCGYENSTDALTFTTDSIPILSHCFNVADLFTGNMTRDFVNQTGNLAYNSERQQVGIDWQLENIDKFDPQANYSRILYHQSSYHPGDKRYDPGSYAYRRINVYGGFNCTERDPNSSRGLLDWYGFNCFSEDEGSCGTLPYSIASFTVMPGSFGDEDRQHGKCLDFARMGAATRHQISWVVLGASVCVLFLVAWLV